MSNGSTLFSNQHAQKPHLVTGKQGVPGEIDDLRRDIAAVLTSLAPITIDEYTNPVGTGAPGAAALLAATPTVAAPVTVLAAGMVAAGVAALPAWPRQITFTTGGSTPADAPANVVITGTDAYGVAQTETLNLAQTGATVTSVKYWGSITKVDYPAADGTDATVSIGIAAAVIKPATATVESPVTLLPANLIQTDLANNPRALVFTTGGSTPGDAPANAVISGTDAQGKAISETLALAQTGTSVTSAYFYKSISSIVYPAADGTDATIAITFAAPLGLSRVPKARAGLTAPTREIYDGTVVTNGTFTAPTTTNKPYGAYTPNTAADGAHDYAVYYEYLPD